ncbi:hypothetical protein GW813_07925 [bacterium]|nr:hypothetical protein [bacterium]PJA75974.1 MAG: hypothetical protein CO151_04290 [bacterium CG_4_9_14_3_um_filter_65_15]
MSRHSIFRILMPFALLLGLAACSDSTKPTTTDPMPDFSLQDVNSTSATADQAVSPRDSIGRVTAWYFGHST